MQANSFKKSKNMISLKQWGDSMLSRMERYYKSSAFVQRRTKRNEDLYKKIYEDAEYTNIEGITSIEKTNEIDLSKIKELLNKEKDEKENKEALEKRKELLTLHTQSLDFEDEKRNYDIRDVLDKAKSKRSNVGDQYYSLRNTQYNILKKINLKEELDKQEPEEDELKKLIDTITSTSMLNKLGDKELSLNILDELKSNGNTQTSRTIGKLLEEAKANEQEQEEKQEIDKSFYTSSVSFTDTDFEDLKEINVTLKKNNVLIKILLVVLLIIILTGIGYFVYTYLA